MTAQKHVSTDAMTTNPNAAAPPAIARPEITHLAQLGVIMVSGQDARSYLQGQLTADLDAFSPDQVQLTCCNSPQGRVQAVLCMIGRSDGIALLLPTTMIDSTIARLRKYVLRAKVKIEFAPHLQVGFAPRSALPELTLPHARSHHEAGGVSYFNLPGHDAVMLLGALAANEQGQGEHLWKLTYLRAGLPQVYPETHEAFVAQMLNLDMLGGISFEKGCYTGQEIIARAHFRGAVKRRMFLFRSEGAPPTPGTRVLAGEQHAGDVVDAVATENGCELLAVISLAQLNNELRVDGQANALTRLDLPYPVG
jgi:folate-binding protein YgfZ